MGSNLREILDNVCCLKIFLSFLNDKERKKLSQKKMPFRSFINNLLVWVGIQYFRNSYQLQKKFFQQRCELGRIDQRNMNQRLNLDIPQNNTFWLLRDILAAMDLLIGMKFRMGTLDDMNHLKNKRIRSVADLLQDQFRLALLPSFLFIEHHDANRALMSSNMQPRAVPLSQSEKCIVGTGLERQVALDSGVLAIVGHEGEIIYIDIDKIVLSGNGDTLSIPLVMCQQSNKNTCMHQKPWIPWGKCMKKGQFYQMVPLQWTYMTSQGPERVTNEILHLAAYLLHNLDKNGIVRLGS
ncbi:LOW QUALITY PROTEIN: hypothetical protein Cgig2_027286 [Carnegiea gigantea]|uniref:DNA-directed RNA polymerase n=1 Tax=Carnegiea gigantea TaxID=171969 RepID=A0A9Q1K3C0_9CARY|nr:LOW QUALITY PROTEIN: hypothetical protein Cgig2_027286 [Carnegiea gigantea]